MKKTVRNYLFCVEIIKVRIRYPVPKAASQRREEQDAAGCPLGASKSVGDNLVCTANLV